MPSHRDVVAPTDFSQKRLLGTLWAGVAISFCFLVFRFYVRLKIHRRCHVEDPFVLAAWLMNLINAAVWQRNVNSLYSFIAVESGQILKPSRDFLSQANAQRHSLFASYLLYYTALWSIKLSFLLFFRNLGIGIRRHMMLWYFVLACTIASYLTCVGMLDYKCLVGSRGQAECESAHAAYYLPLYLRLQTFFDTTTDGLIILISTTLLCNASIEFRKKLALTGIFSLTILVISVSIARVTLTTDGPLLDLTWLLLWSGLEMTVAIIVACLASFRMLYIRSERCRRSALPDHHFNRDLGYLVDGPSIPLNARLASPTCAVASKNTNHKRPTSTDAFEEAILPMDDVYIQHRNSMLFDPRERSDGIRSPLEAPVVRLPSYRLHHTLARETQRRRESSAQNTVLR